MKDFYFGDFEEQIREIYRKIVEEKEKTLTEIITKYDFIVGSIELKEGLEKILPEGASIVYSRYVEDATTIYAIKKFDIMDFLKERYL